MADPLELGFLLPDGDDYISEGDNAIARNAQVSANLYELAVRQQQEGDAAVRDYADSEISEDRARLESVETKAAKIAGLETGKMGRLSMPGTADFNDYVTPDRIAVSTGNNKTNIPAAVSGSLDVSTTGTIVLQTYTTAEAPQRIFTRRRNAGVWSAWLSATPYSPSPANGTDFNDLTFTSIYPIALGTHPNQPVKLVGTLEVLPFGGGLIQRFTTNENAPREFLRRRTGTTWSAWVQLRDAEFAALDQRLAKIETDGRPQGTAPGTAPAAAGSPTQYGHTVRLARARQLVGMRSSPRAQVTLICDHGTVRFRDIVYPILKRFGLPCTLAINSQKVAGGILHDPAQEVDSWDQLKTWAAAGVEIANHGRTHLDTDSMQDLIAEIVTGHEELETNLGRPIHSWVQPSAHGDLGKWFGFRDGISWDGWAGTDAGRLILDRHAVATGTIYPIGRYRLYGEPPIGMQGHWLDADDKIPAAREQIAAAQAEKTGLLLRLHPGYVGGQNTVAALETFFGWLAAERDAGRLDVVTLAQWAFTRIEN